LPYLTRPSIEAARIVYPSRPVGELTRMGDHDTVVGRQRTYRQQDFNPLSGTPICQTITQQGVRRHPSGSRDRLRPVAPGQLVQRSQQLLHYG
jgi:hypothetical protein